MDTVIEEGTVRDFKRCVLSVCMRLPHIGEYYQLPLVGKCEDNIWIVDSVDELAVTLHCPIFSGPSSRRVRVNHWHDWVMKGHAYNVGIGDTAMEKTVRVSSCCGAELRSQKVLKRTLLLRPRFDFVYVCTSCGFRCTVDFRVEETEFARRLREAT